VAAASYRWLEQPIRRGTWPALGRRRLLVVAPLAAVVLVGAAVAGGAEAASRAVAEPSHPVVLASPVVARPAAPPTRAASVPVAPPRRVLFVGDSLVQQAFPTFAARLWAEGIGAEAIGGDGQSLMSGSGQAWASSLQRAVTSYDPDVVVLESCCGAFRFDAPSIGADGHVVPADAPAYWADWKRLAVQATAIASSRGAVVLWVLGPPTHTNGWYGPIDGRVPVANAIYRSVVACDPSAATVDWTTLGAPGGTYAAALPDASGHLVAIRVADGFHFTPAGWDLQARVTLPAVVQAWTLDGGRTAAWRGACP
jgi:hypothetical protein